MKIGINAWVWQSPFTADSVRLITKAAEMGFEAFTVPVEDPSLIDIRSIKSVLANSPMTLYLTGAYGPDRDLTHDDPAVRKNSLNYISELLEICEKLEVKVLAGPAYSAVGKRRHLSDEARKREWDRAVDGLTKASHLAAERGVTLAIEPLNRFETDLVNTCAQVKTLIQAVNHSNIRIHLDTFHMHIEEKNLFDAICLAGEDLVYIDASESDRGTPGQGQVYWSELARALKKIDYKGDCIIESFTPECLTIADAAAIWRPLAPSQDELAFDGLAFLKTLRDSHNLY